MLKKAKPTISLLAAATMAFTVLGNTSIKAAGKDDIPSNNKLIIGDMYFNFSGSNVIKGMLYAINNRGANPDDLKVIYVKRAGRTPSYYDFGESYDTTGDGLEIDAWESVKGEYDPISNSFTPYDSGATLPTSSSVGIKPRSGYEGIITINGDQVEIPANTTPKILKGAIQADDGIYGQTYELFDGDKAVADEVSLATGNTLKVTSEDGTANHTYNLVVQSGGGGGQEDSADLEFKTNLDQGTLSYTAGAADVDPLTVEVQGKDGATTGTISYQWYKQTVGTSPLRATAVPVGEAIEGEISASFTPPVNAVGTTLYYVIAKNTEEGKNPSSIASKMVTVIVTEGEIAEGDFTVSDYVYNDDSKDTKTMGKLTGTAPSKAKITIEANFEEIATTDAKEDGTWEATFPRQNAGTKLKVTLTANGKTATIVKDVKAADTKDIEDFRKNIDLNKLIEVRDNLYWSEDNGATGIKAADLKDYTDATIKTPLKDGDYYINDKASVEAFKAYVDLIEAVLGYKYQISTVDLNYVQNKAIPTLETYKGKIQQVGEVSTKATVLISREGNGRVEVSYKDDSHSVTDGVYEVKADKGTSVTFTAKADAGNHFVKWVVDGNDDTTSGTTLTKEVKADMTVKAVFEKDGGSGEGEEMNLTLSPNTYESINVGEYVYTEVTAAGKNAPDFDIELTVPSDKLTATYVDGKIAIGGVSASDAPIVINVKATATGYKDGTGTITVNKVDGSEVPPEDKTETPVITGYELTMLPTTARITGYPDIIAQVTGTATKGAEITLKDGTGATIATESKVVTDDAGNWTAILTDRLNGGTEVVAIAELEGKLPSDASTVLKIEKVEDTNPISDLIATINERLKSVGSSEKGDGTDVTPDATIKEYLPKTDYEAITTLRDLLQKLLDGKMVSVQDIEFVKSDVTNAWNVTEAKIADIPAIGDTVELKLSKSGKGNVTITAADGVIVGDPSTVTDGVYTIKSGATVTINAIPDGTKVTGWVIDGKPEVSEVTTRDIDNIIENKEVQVLFVAEDKVEDVKTTIEETNKLIEKKVSANVDLKGESDPVKQEQIIKEAVDTKVRAEVEALSLPEGTTIKSIEVIKEDEDTNARKVVEKTYKARVTLSCGGIEFTVIIEVKVSTEVADEFNNLGISNITDAVVGQPSDLVVTGIPEGVKDFNLTTTDTDVTIAKSGDKFTLTPSKVMTGKDVIITATATDYEAKDITIKVTATESTTDKENFGELKIDAITDGVKDKAVTRTVYGLPEAGIASFSLTVPTDMADKVSIKHTKGSKDVEITPLVVLTNEPIKLTAKADNYNDGEISFQVTATDKSSDDKEFEGLGVRNITGATVNEAVYMDVYGIPEGVANFNIVSKNNELITVEYNKTKSQWEVTPKVAMDDALVEVTASADGYKDKDLAFKITTIKEDTKNAIKIVSVKTGENTFTDIPQDGSVEAIVYENTVNGTVYQIYARLSGSKAEFKIENEAVSFALDLVAYSDAETFSQADAINLLNGLELDTSKKVLMKEIKRTEGGTGTLNITLSSDVIKSIDGENPTEVSITFKYKQGSEVSSDNAILSPLVLKAIKSHM